LVVIAPVIAPPVLGNAASAFAPSAATSLPSKVLFVVIAPVKTAPDSSALSEFRLLKLLSTSVFVNGLPLPDLVTIVAIYISPSNKNKRAALIDG
jgi:hypothetical protein